jgi:flavodoxin
MKSAIIYYSYNGNTRKVAVVLAERLKAKGDVEVIEVKAFDESNNFFTQAARALWRKKARIAATGFDLGKYDLLCFGTPVWAFAPAPAMNTYLGDCFGTEGKDIILFTTYGSGAGKERCIDYMQEILVQKGAKGFKRFFVQQEKAKDKDFVLSEIDKTLPL